MADDVLAEALARVEFKVDLLMKHLQVKTPLPMAFGGHTCPACNTPVEYQIDVMKQVVTRKCACTTGKIVFSISFPQPGESNGGKENSTGSPNIEGALKDFEYILGNDNKKGKGG